MSRQLLDLSADPSLVTRDGQRATAGLLTLQEVLELAGGGAGLGRPAPGARPQPDRLESVLLGLGLWELAGPAREAVVGLEEFLLLREEELESLGAGLGARKRLVTAQAELHRRDWERGSLPRLPLADRRDGLMVTAPDVAAMLANIKQHGRLMRASLGYLRQQALQHRLRLAEVGGDLVPPDQLLLGAGAAAAELRGLAAGLERELAQLPGARKARPAVHLLAGLGGLLSPWPAS